jgi:hypothetical protein
MIIHNLTDVEFVACHFLPVKVRHETDKKKLLRGDLGHALPDSIWSRKVPINRGNQLVGFTRPD